MNGKPVQSVLELAKESGRSTGLVTTAQVTDATPAAFWRSLYVPVLFGVNSIDFLY
ncbi:hypothetical protein GCM10020331_050890 [Ectobacillus funiculus]